MIAGTMLVLMLPGLLILAVIVAVLSKRSPLIAHNRIGQGGRAIWVLKVRTMWDGARFGRFHLIEQLQPSPLDSVVPKIANDPRVRSPFAAACRRYSIDELPQLWNVLLGDMALVGPRPLTPDEIEAYYGPDAAELLSRKPGLTGLWQVHGRSRLNYRQRRKLDLFMIRKWSLSLYLRILITTVPQVLMGRDAR
jgi:lipopolysaccharide/colanic/teichoic acid biosynthesis glycosyltransferase